MQETSFIPHGSVLLSGAVAAVLTFVTTIAAIWFRRKREPAEVARVEAETRSLHVSTEISPVGITLETLREIQSVIDKAEVRREAWLLKEEQLRTQIVFWRNKAEELDGALIDSREANGLLETRLKHHEAQEKKLKSLLDYHNINYSELDRPKT